MHPNSLLAYTTEQSKLSKREQMIVDAISRSAKPYGLGAITDREIMRLLGFTDCNSVRPRITSLIQKGILREVGNTKDSVSGKTVRVVALA